MEKEELLEIIRESLENHTVEEALRIKQEQDDVVKESFDVTWQNYTAATTLRKEILKSFALTKYRMVFLRFLTMIVNYNALDELDYLRSIINESNLEIKDQKVLLESIRNAITTLQAHNVVECNYQICELLSNIYDKDQLLFNTVIKEMESSVAFIKGINITYGSSTKESLAELNKNIDEGVLALGLKQ